MYSQHTSRVYFTDRDILRDWPILFFFTRLSSSSLERVKSEKKIKKTKKNRVKVKTAVSLIGFILNISTPPIPYLCSIR